MTLTERLRAHPATDEDIVLEADPERGIVEVAAARGTNRVFLLFGLFVAALAAIVVGGAVMDGMESTQLLAFVTIGVVFAVLLGPRLWTALRGGATWRRSVRILDGAVEATDTMRGRAVTWRAPLSEYEGIAHRIGTASGVPASGVATKVVRHDILELVHPDPGRTIPLWKRPRTATGGMGMAEMIRAGREGRKEEVEAALNSTRNPQLRAFAERAAAATGLPLLCDPDDFAGGA